MAKRFKLKLSLSSFQFCRSNEACGPKSPSPSILLPDNPPPTPDASTKITPLNSFFISTTDHCNHDSSQKMYNSPVSVTYDSDKYSNEWSITPPKGRKTNYTSKNYSKRKCSVSSVVSGWFSSGEEEVESLMSFSENFNSSCDFGVVNSTVLNTNNNYRSLRTRRTRKKNGTSANVNTRRLKRYVSNSWKNGLTTTTMMSCAEEGKVNESVAVVKNSENPYEDFRGSMMEMVLEKQMFEAKDLEQLLQSFLSLNSRHHHAAIVRAFSEIWEVLFS